MSKSRIHGSERKTRTQAQLDRSNKVHRFFGIALSGGRADRTCLAILEYFPEHKKIFLVKIIDRVRAEEFISADLKVHEIISQYAEGTESVAFDVPLTLPKCLRCDLKCPGYEACSEPEIKWMHDISHAHNRKKKPRKMFTPYTQRCAEAYLHYTQEENFEVQHALGANLAPLTARALFISRRLNVTCHEVMTKIAVWRLGIWCRMNKSGLRRFRNSVGGEEVRKSFLEHISHKLGIFVYQQDAKLIAENHHAFDAFVCALMGYYKFIDKVEPRPKGFPRSESWITLPL